MSLCDAWAGAGVQVPLVLGELCRHLLRPSTNALDMEGIFRVGGDGARQAAVKALLNAEQALPQDTQGHIVSNLIKV